MPTPQPTTGPKTAILTPTLLLPALLLVGLMALTASCRNATPPMRFYSLTPLQASPDMPMADPEHRSMGVAVGVGPLDIPLAVDRPNIIIRTGPNTLKMAEYDRWSGTLQGDMLQVVTQNLGLLLESDKVVGFPWSNFMVPEYRIPITVHRFDGELGGQLVLDATWAVARANTRQSLVVRRTVTTETVEGDDYEALVAASSRALADLSTQIADEMIRLRGR